MTSPVLFSRSVLLPLIVIASLAGLMAQSPDAFARASGQTYLAGEVLIKFAADTSPTDVEAILSDLGAKRIRKFDHINVSHESISLMSVDDAIARYSGDDRIEFIEPNYLYHADVVPNDQYFNYLWGMRNTGQVVRPGAPAGIAGADIDATLAWDLFTGSPAVLVAIIDSGVDYTHPDLAANMYVNPGEIAGNSVDDDGNGYVDDVRGWDFLNNDNDPMDDMWHGTHCAGTLGAVGNNGIGVVGINWNVSILPLKFLDAVGDGNTADAISAIHYATMMGARVTSNSWGGGPNSTALRDAILEARDAGILFVASAGNNALNNDVVPYFPANTGLANVVSVAGTDATDHLGSYSNFGPVRVHIAAPGSDIASTVPNNGYDFSDGTSMAVPLVAGVAALLFGRYPEMSMAEVKDQILSRADSLPALTGLIRGAARLNAYRALALLDSIPPDAVIDLFVFDRGTDWLELDWTTTGDDGSTGKAARFELRYSTAPITEANYSLATIAANPPPPLPAGGYQTMRVNGLASSTLYYLALRVIDERGNASAISNPASESTLDHPTATEVSLVSQSAGPGLVRITWYGAEIGGPVAVYRRTIESGWARFGSLAPANDGYLVLEDRSVAPGTRYGYRLGLPDDGGERFLGETWLDVPVPATLAIHGLISGSADGDVSAAFSLPEPASGSLELLDLSGRRLRSVDLAGFGAGRHAAVLGRTAAFPSGIYLLRLRHPAGERVAKCAIIH